MNASLTFSEKPLSVSNKLLLSLYAVIPMCLLLAAIDTLLLGHQLREALPSNPGELMWWAIIFNFPHIISSLVTLADKEYINHYKPRFKKALLIIVSGVLFINFIMPVIMPDQIAMGLYGLFFLFFAAYTMYHVLSQQFGIGMMMMGVRPDRRYEHWRYLSSIAATLMYLLAFAGPNLKTVQWGAYNLYDMTQLLAAVFVVIASVAGLILVKDGNKRLGILYVSANIIMLYAVWVLCYMEYSVFVVLIPRFVHDVTAFIIYSVHDHNRNRETQHNLVYKALSFLPFTPVILCPIIALLLANSIECAAYFVDFSLGFNPALNSECFASHFYTPLVTNPLPDHMRIGMQIMFICGFFHYHIEGFVWKRESIHRHSIAFS
jgi:hypothetical protein